jgi:hypothetical protein
MKRTFIEVLTIISVVILNGLPMSAKSQKPSSFGYKAISKNGKIDLWIGSRNTGLCRFDGKTFTSFSE